MPGPPGLSVLELFCGIGGCAAALDGRARVTAAVDQNRVALAVYARNFPAHRVVPQTVESLTDAQWRAWAADLWWMSPPCPPYTTRGARRDVADPRAASFLALVERVRAWRPRYLALENVPGFAGSRAHALLRAELDDLSYHVRETLVCPTELGVPNRRRRFYLVAGQDRLGEWPERTGTRIAIASLLDAEPSPALRCEEDLSRRYGGALNIVDAADPDATAACFTSAYGRSLVRSGSYVRTPSGLRRFSPAEILRQLDYPPAFALPPDLPMEIGWRLVGNSVSVRAVRWVLSAVPGLAAGS